MEFQYDIILSIVCGIVSLGIGLWGFFENLKIEFDNTRTIGIVIDYEEELGGDNDLFFHPIIEYKTKEGRTFKQKYPIGLTYKKHELSDSLDIIYENSNHENISSVNFWSRNLGPIMFSIVGIIFIILGVFELI